MPLATVDDLAALGGVQVDVSPTSPGYERALRLLELAEGQVLAFLDHFGVSVEVVDGWEAWRKNALTGVVAEVAARRLQSPAAPGVDPYMVAPPPTIKLNQWERDALRDLLPDGGANKSVSVEVVRADSWLGMYTEDDA